MTHHRNPDYWQARERMDRRRLIIKTMVLSIKLPEPVSRELDEAIFKKARENMLRYIDKIILEGVR